MFEQTFIQSQAKTRKPWTVAVSLSLQCVVVVILLLIPLLHPEALRMPVTPPPHLIRTWITLPPLPPPKSGLRTAAVSAPTMPRPFVYVSPNIHAPVARHVDVPSADQEAPGWSGLASGGLGSSLPEAAQLPPAVAVKPPAVQAVIKPAVSGPLQVSGGVESARLVFGPHPAYPPLAKAARSQGIVKLEAIIAADGAIRNLRVVSGPPLLVDAAIEAVRQWRYHPTLLNGVAVEVVTEIDVNFSLTR